MRRVLLAAPLALALFASPLPAAAQPWVVAPASDGAEIISQLFWFTLVLATIVFVLVEGLLIYSSLRFRRRAPLPLHEPPQMHGNTRLEVMWATVPALILVGLFGITVSRLGDLSQLPTDPNTLHISVTGRQFQWDFAYGSSGVKSTNDLHIPVGTPAHLRRDLDRRDPQLLGARPVRQDRREPRGRINHITFKANQPGTYRGVCAELCGAGPRRDAVPRRGRLADRFSAVARAATTRRGRRNRGPARGRSGTGRGGQARAAASGDAGRG